MVSKRYGPGEVAPGGQGRAGQRSNGPPLRDLPCSAAFASEGKPPPVYKSSSDGQKGNPHQFINRNRAITITIYELTYNYIPTGL